LVSGLKSDYLSAKYTPDIIIVYSLLCKISRSVSSDHIPVAFQEYEKALSFQLKILLDIIFMGGYNVIKKY